MTAEGRTITEKFAVLKFPIYGVTCKVTQRAETTRGMPPGGCLTVVFSGSLGFRFSMPDTRCTPVAFKLPGCGHGEQAHQHMQEAKRGPNRSAACFA